MMDRDEPLPVGMVDIEEEEEPATWFSDEEENNSDHDEW
jgi:hypothetical protein